MLKFGKLNTRTPLTGGRVTKGLLFALEHIRSLDTEFNVGSKPHIITTGLFTASPLVVRGFYTTIYGRNVLPTADIIFLLAN